MGIKVGDVVELNSGGPAMTVEDIGKYGMGATRDRAMCVWFDGNKRQQELFELTSIRKQDSGPSVIIADL